MVQQRENVREGGSEFSQCVKKKFGKEREKDGTRAHAHARAFSARSFSKDPENSRRKNAVEPPPLMHVERHH